ncbi:MAG: NAD-dependent epimerase/dehydratase family protein [bacterium]
MYFNSQRKSTKPNGFGGFIATVLITGGTGFIGSHTVEHFLQQGFDVHCIIRPGRRDLGWLTNLPVTVIQSDLMKIDTLHALVNSFDYIVHIAGITKAVRKKDFFEGNVETTRHLLEFALQSTRLKKILFMGSLTAVGPSPDGFPFDESAPCRPITSYGVSKLEAEQLCLSYRDRLPIVVLRPPAVYGPRDRDILEFFRWIRWGYLPIVAEAGKTLNIIHAQDLARAALLATTSDAAVGKVYFASNEEITSFEELGTILAGIAQKKITHLPIPVPLMYGIAGIAQTISTLLNKPPLLNVEKVRDFAVKHWVCSPNRIRQDLGFSSEIPLQAGLEKTYRWYKAQGWL